MITVGIMSSNEESFMILKHILKKNQYKIIEVKDGENLEDLDTLVIYVNQNEKPESFLPVIKSSLCFCWLITFDTLLSQEKEIYLQLGVNGILSNEESDTNIFLLIDNMIRKGKYFIRNTETSIKYENINIKIDSTNMSVICKNGDEVFLTKLEFKFLDLLMQNRNKAISYEMIYKALWGNKDDDAIQYKKCRISNIAFHLREKLSMDGESIKTIRNIGYLFST